MTATIPHEAAERLIPIMETILAGMTDEQRDAIDAGQLATAVLYDGTVAQLEVRLIDQNGTQPVARLDPTRVGLHVFGDPDKPEVVYVPAATD